MSSSIEELKNVKALQEKHRKELQENRDKINARKKRVSRLIKRGAIIEGFIGNAENMTDEEFYHELCKLCGMREDS